MVDTSDYLVPTTLLQAVNLCMESIGQTPIANLLNASSNVDSEIALNRVLETSREFQQEGWQWNTELGWTMEPDPTTGEILFPANTVKVFELYYPGGSGKDLVQRGRRLYDRVGHTFNIGVDVKANLTVILDYEDLPEAARWFIAVKASRRVSAARLVSTTAWRFSKTDEDEARTRAEQADAETDQRTLRGNPHMLRMLNRGRGGRQISSAAQGID